MIAWTRASQTADRIGKAGGKAQPFVADVADVGQVAALAKDVKARLGPIDILVNSAGVYYATPVGATDEAAHDRMMDINVKGTWNAINAAGVALFLASAEAKAMHGSNVLIDKGFSAGL
jgi:3-oxoacyl-[acyl-carrier protein] reductase